MITQIKLANFKCFKNETIQLSSLNILAGLNGMGKSTLIQSILLLRQNEKLGFSEKGLSLNGDLVQLGCVQDVLYQYSDSREIEIELASRNFGKALWHFDAQNLSSDFLPLLEVDIKQSFFQSSLFSHNFHYLNAERVGPRLYHETSNYKVLSQNQVGSKGELAVNYFSEFQNTEIPIKALRHRTTAGYTLSEQMNAWMSEIRPGVRLDVSTNLEMGLVSLMYQFLDGKDIGNKFRSPNVGFGLSYVFSILLAILSSKPGALLILENPEAHVHPRGQAQIGILLAIAAANGMQIILETHSDHIINGLRVAVKHDFIKPAQTNILFFSNNKPLQQNAELQVLSPKIDENGRIDFWPEGFLDEWDINLMKLL